MLAIHIGLGFLAALFTVLAISCFFVAIACWHDLDKRPKDEDAALHFVIAVILCWVSTALIFITAGVSHILTS